MELRPLFLIKNMALNIPNLSGVIAPQDISTKGTGSYAADYINWARVAHLLQVNAAGWQFHLRLSPEGSHVWKAPNGTGYLVGYFVSPDEGIPTADFPQSVMDNRNNPVAFEKISARDVTDTHRRCLAAAAAFTFGLAWELWAKEKIEDPYLRDGAVTSEGGSVISQKQLNMLFAVANEKKLTNEQQAEIVTGRFGFSSRKLITTDKFEQILSAYQNYQG